jgi:hypothetical protein
VEGSERKGMFGAGGAAWRRRRGASRAWHVMRWREGPGQRHAQGAAVLGQARDSRGGPGRRHVGPTTQYRAATNLIQTQIQTESNYIQIRSNFDHSKKDISKLKKFEIKYSLEDLKKMTNFLHRNFSRFVMEIELKFQKTSMS